MLYKISAIVCFVISIATNSYGQDNLQDILSEITKNNNSIKLAQQQIEVNKLSYQIGLTPENPTIEYEHLNGNQAAIGTQKDFAVLQAFDFPTAYAKKKQVANAQISAEDIKLTAVRQEVLLHAKNTCNELIYINKKAEILNSRLLTIEKIYEDFETRVEEGQSSKLDFTKVKLELLSIKNAISQNGIECANSLQMLKGLNGGLELTFNETSYNPINDLPDLEILEKDIETADPEMKMILENQKINQKQLELNKALALPKFVGGFRSQTTLNQTYQGIHIGMSIPLWENKNTVKKQKAALILNDFKAEAHEIEHHAEIEQLYQKHEALKTMVSDYLILLNELNSEDMLSLALKLGEISSTEYFYETSYFYNLYDEYLSMEKNLNQINTTLFKYKL